MRRIVLLGVMVLASCAASGPYPERPKPMPQVAAERYSISTADRAAIEDGIKRQLKDPTSPIFGDMVAAKQGELVTVCGLVNAKNSFGGYTGSQPFIGALIRGQKPVFSLLDIGSEPYKAQAIASVCAQRGVL